MWVTFAHPIFDHETELFLVINTSLNNLIRDYLKRIVNEGDYDKISKEFEELAINHSGKSSNSYVFNRDEIYSRGL